MHKIVVRSRTNLTCSRMIPADSSSSSQEFMTPADEDQTAIPSKKTYSSDIFNSTKSWLDVMNVIITELEQFMSRDEFSDSFISDVITKRLAMMNILNPMLEPNEEKYFFDERLKLLEIDEFDDVLSDLRVIAVQIMNKLWEFHNTVSQLMYGNVTPTQEDILGKCLDIISSMEEHIGDDYFAGIGTSVLFNPNVNESQVHSMDFFYDGLFYSGPIFKLTQGKVRAEVYNPNTSETLISSSDTSNSTSVKSNIKSFILDVQMLKFFIQKDEKLLKRYLKPSISIINSNDFKMDDHGYAYKHIEMV